MSDDIYMQKATENLKRIEGLMALNIAKSDKWWRLRRQFLAQEARLQSRLESRKRS